MVEINYKEIALVVFAVLIIEWLALVIIAWVIRRSNRNDSSSNIIDSDDAGID